MTQFFVNHIQIVKDWYIESAFVLLPQGCCDIILAKGKKTDSVTFSYSYFMSIKKTFKLTLAIKNIWPYFITNLISLFIVSCRAQSSSQFLLPNYTFKMWKKCMINSPNLPSLVFLWMGHCKVSSIITMEITGKYSSQITSPYACRCSST